MTDQSSLEYWMESSTYWRERAKVWEQRAFEELRRDRSLLPEKCEASSQRTWFDVACSVLFWLVFANGVLAIAIFVVRAIMWLTTGVWE